MRTDPYEWLARLCMPWPPVPPVLPERTAVFGEVLPPLPDDCYPPGAVPLPVELSEA